MRTEYHQITKNQDSTREVSIGPQGGSLPTAGPAGGDPLLYLYSNICTETTEDQKTEAILGLSQLLSPYHKKAAHSLHVNVERLIHEAPSLGHVGFMTLTFKENITDPAEAAKRFKSLNTHFLAKDPRFGNKIVVKEPQQRGAWHFHVLIQLSEDIKTGFEFDSIETGDYTSASPYLRTLWRDLRESCENHGFGRSELLPVKSNAQAMGYYLGKYISKGIGQRSEEQKNVRLVNYSKGWTRNSPKFAWNTDNSALWRKNLKNFAMIHGCTEFYQLSEKLGPNWAYRYVDDIINIQEALAAFHSEWKIDRETMTRIHRETGEVQLMGQWGHKTTVAKKIEENSQLKTYLLHAEIQDRIPATETYREVLKRHRKKETARLRIEAAKRQFKPTEEEIEKIKADRERGKEWWKWLRSLPEAPF